eukprot:5769802-Pyramimonas_sp.AAC.1
MIPRSISPSTNATSDFNSSHLTSQTTQRMVTLRAAKTNHHTQRAAKAWRANTDATPKRITERGQRTSL